MTFAAIAVIAGCAEPHGSGRGPAASAARHRAPLGGADEEVPSSEPAIQPAAHPAPRDPVAARAAAPSRPVERALYGWLADDAIALRRLDDTFPAPAGYRRVDAAAGSFGAFLRGLPLRPPGAEVHAHDGSVLRPAGDPRIAAVVEIDAGTRDLQQCADTAIRLHAEWLWSGGREEAIGYHFTSGDLATWSRHRAGERPVIEGQRVQWERRAGATSGRAAFRSWLDLVFSYAGTVSLARTAAPVAREDLRPGDVFVLPGGPGHAILVLDLAVDDRGRRVALLGQGFMPAQDAHVLAASPGVTWFDLEVDAIDTPFWPAPFPWSSLRRMRTASGATD